MSDQKVPISIKKILGPLEKVTMCAVVSCFSVMQKFTPHESKTEKTKQIQNKKRKKIIRFLFKWANRLYAAIAWLDARIMPRNLSTVLLMKCILTTHKN